MESEGSTARHSIPLSVVDTHRHGQQMVNGQAASLLRDVVRNVVGQHVHHSIVHREQPIGDRESHGGRCRLWQ